MGVPNERQKPRQIMLKFRQDTRPVGQGMAHFERRGIHYETTAPGPFVFRYRRRRLGLKSLEQNEALCDVLKVEGGLRALSTRHTLP